MKFERLLSKANHPVEDQVQWRRFSMKLSPHDSEPTEVEVPAAWSDTAAQICVTRYFRKAGVPSKLARTSHYEVGDATQPPGWLMPSRSESDSAFGSETSVRQLLHRLAGHWTYVGWKHGYFSDGTKTEITGFSTKNGHSKTSGINNDEQNARIFYDELYLILANQLAAPNSPQWFNTGLWWAYGIEGPASGQWAVDYAKLGRGTNIQQCVYQTSSAYESPQPHACFIQPVEDDLVNSGGIMDLWTRESRLFKQGSGTGTNFSTLRAANEPLSGGGRSSGLMSFLEIGDRAAGAIKSGGVTRRAAKMVIVDADHPDIEEFVDWKAREEQKAAAMYVGSALLSGEYRAAIPAELRERIGDHAPTEVFGIDYEGEAIRSISGQNANNTVRIRDEFMNKLSEPQGALWYLRERTTGKLVKSMQATYLWNKICRAAWASADPGLQFHDTINKWHTCKTDGEIRASNPCSEYMFLDDTACNLASLNLGAFYKLTDLRDPTSYKFDVELFCHVARLMTVVLDISVSMASFPSREIAIGSYNYRTLGLGYANLGGLLMRMGLPYDSDEGHNIASSITALMTGIAYETSAHLADELGPFPRFEDNSESMLHVIDMHAGHVNRLTGIDHVTNAAKQTWNRVFVCKKFRNAQVTLLAPTGTIGLLMDCDTLGIEPDFALIKKKSLAGGGSMTLINASVEQALNKLGYKSHVRNLICAYIKEHGTVEDCLDLQPEHQTVFDCAAPPEGFSRAIAPMGHVNMMAAVQPFLSGAISKTVNMPNSATVEDVSDVYMAAWKLGLKAVAIYRDGSKLAQPLETQAKREPDGSSINELNETYESSYTKWKNIKNEIIRTKAGTTQIPPQAILVDMNELRRGEREYLPWRRQPAEIQKIKIGPGGQTVILTLGCYPDGRLGELYVELSRTGPTLHAFGNIIGILISIGLQYGVPVEEYVKRLSGRKFEPSGLVEGHENIKYAASIADLIARELGLTFLGRTDMGQAPPVESIIEDVKRDTIRSSLDICPKCGEHSLTQNGSCNQCLNGECGFNDGCGG